MSSTLSKFVALFVAALLAVGVISATPLAASAADSSSVTLTAVDSDTGSAVNAGGYFYYYSSITESYSFGGGLPQNGSGTFTITGLSDTISAYVDLSADGYQSFNGPIKLSDGADQTITLEKLRLSGIVTADDGSPISAGTVELYTQNGTTPIASTSIVDGSYSFDVPAQNYYVVRFEADGFETVLNDGQPDDVSGASGVYIGTTTTLNVTLSTIASYELSGSYTGNYYGLSGHVYFERLVGDSYVLAGSAELGSDYDASYSKTLRTGYYRVTTYYPGAKTTKRYVSITDQDVVMPSITLAINFDYDYVNFTAAGKLDGTPTVATAYQQVTAGNWQPVSTGSSTDPSGYIYVPVTPGSSYRVVVSDPTHLYKSRALAPDRTFTDAAGSGDVDVAALPADYNVTSGYTLYANLALVSATSTGSFTYLGKPVPNATVDVYAVTNDGIEDVATTTTNNDGDYSVALPAGTYTVGAQADGYSTVVADQDNTITIDENGGGDFDARVFTHKNDVTLSGAVTNQYGAPFSTDVTLQQKVNGEWADADIDGLANPQTSVHGAYSWNVPSGTFRVKVGDTTSDAYTVDPSAVVSTIVVTDPDAATPTDTSSLPTLDAAKVDTEESAPSVTWIDGWATSSVEWFVDGVSVSTDDTYTPTFAQLGKTLSAKVTGTDGTHDFTATLAGVVISTNTFEANDTSITGIDEDGVHVGDILTAHGNWGTGGVTDSFTWTRDGVTVGTGSTYTLTEADLANTLSVSAHGVKDGYTSADHTGSIDVPKGSLDDLSITQSGAGTIGSALTASVSGVPDGTDVTYRWYSRSQLLLKKTNVKISGNTDDLLTEGASHTITAADFSNGLYVVATTPESTSYLALNAQAGAEISTLDFDATDVAATVTGTLAVGQTLTGAITGGPAGTIVEGSYWEYGDEDESDGSTFAVTSDQLGQDITFVAYVSAPGYDSTYVRTTVHILGAAQKAGTAVITGTPTVGSVLSGAASNWVDPEDPDLSFGWYIDGTRVSTRSYYRVQAADQGKTITLRVTGNADGYEPATAEASIAVPLNTFVAGTPTVTGTSSVGSVLTATTGTWPTGVKLDLQWLRNGVNIDGETGLTHTVVAADQGANITFRVTASESYFATQIVTVTTAIPAANVTSTTTAPTVIEKIVTVTTTVTVHTFGITPTPKVTGKAKVGSTLKVKSAAWKPVAKFTYQWFANGKPITGATKSSLKLTKSIVGKKIRVRVSGAKSGYKPESTYSDATAKVAK